MRVLYFLIPLIISLILEFPVKRIALKFGIYAKENERTIHHGKIPRIGGVAIFIAFMVGVLLFVEDNITSRAVIISGSIIFLEGLLDDIFDVPPIVKIIFQLAAATVLVFMGNVYLKVIRLPFNIVFRVNILGIIVTYFWIVGITNAVNLLDGLDGLAGGFGVIVLMTIAIISAIFHTRNVYVISLVLAGATMGFLYGGLRIAVSWVHDCGYFGIQFQEYNFHYPGHTDHPAVCPYL